jgi:hypothetical protein
MMPGGATGYAGTGAVIGCGSTALTGAGGVIGIGTWTTIGT